MPRVAGTRVGMDAVRNDLLAVLLPLAGGAALSSQIADLLNVEDSAYELKQGFYRTIWDTIDPSGALHNVGDPGI